MSDGSALFLDSRRLLGPNRYFAGPGAVLDVPLPAGHDDETLARWRQAVTALGAGLGWPTAPIISIRHASGATLALQAPPDQLQTACDLNEAAWSAATEAMPLDADSLPDSLRQESAREREPNLITLLAQARDRSLPVFVDDDEVSVGVGSKGRTWPRHALPPPEDVRWEDLSDAPLIVVTGTNGKTTTVRLCARFAAAVGHVVGYNCTEGVIVKDALIASGDYAGPAGARRVVRHPDVTFAVLEAARGGILRRGLATDRARIAIVTNVAPDHFGEYGIDDLRDLTEAKLAVARLVRPQGLLVINADCPLLLEQAQRLGHQLGLFATDDDHPALAAHRAQGGATCGVKADQLRLHHRGAVFDLGAVADMPLTVGGAALYNIGNIAASALAAVACGIAPALIAASLLEFGRTRQDNAGRLERWSFDGKEVLLDYAHNPEGLAGLLRVAASLRRDGRLGLIMGQAGNRSDADIALLAQTAASIKPDLVLLKDEPGFLRGRAIGEVPALLRAALIAAGLNESRAHIVLDELDAGFALLAWARPGDVVVLSAHGDDSRPRLRAALDLLQRVS